MTVGKGKGHVYLMSRAVSDNHLGCDGSGDPSYNSDSVITLNLLLGKLLVPVILPDLKRSHPDF